MKHQDDELDRLLDRSLNEYSAEAPRSGLEQRILANLEVSGATPKRWWIWAAAPVCAGVLIAAVLWSLSQTKVTPPPPIANGSAPAVERVSNSQTPRVATAAKRPHRRTNVRSATVSQAPRLPTFPSQTDEAQARLLLRFVQGQPAVAKQVVREEEQFQELAFRNFDRAEDSMVEEQEER